MNLRKNLRNKKKELSPVKHPTPLPISKKQIRKIFINLERKDDDSRQKSYFRF